MTTYSAETLNIIERRSLRVHQNALIGDAAFLLRLSRDVYVSIAIHVLILFMSVKESIRALPSAILFCSRYNQASD